MVRIWRTALLQAAKSDPHNSRIIARNLCGTFIGIHLNDVKKDIGKELTDNLDGVLLFNLQPGISP